ncbi:putative tetratricopeptide-like helical domain superfamily [Helianthus debilis subsp. tardiflorus]
MLTIRQQSLQKHNQTPQSTFEQNYKNISNLLSATRSRTLPNDIQLHAQIIKLGLQTIPPISHYLINFYSKTQLSIDSQQIFEQTHIKSSTPWSSVISSFAQNELPALALQYFKKIIAFAAILSSYDVDLCVHCYAVKIAYDGDVFVASSMVDMYAKCGRNGDTHQVFDEMSVRNVVSWSGMIYGYAQLGENEDALWLFKQALFQRFEVNDFTFTSVIRVCGNTMPLGLGKQLHRLCLRLSFRSSTFFGSSLISATIILLSESQMSVAFTDLDPLIF